MLYIPRLPLTPGKNSNRVARKISRPAIYEVGYIVEDQALIHESFPSQRPVKVSHGVSQHIITMKNILAHHRHLLILPLLTRSNATSNFYPQTV